MTIAEKIRTLREQRNWSQRELAKRSELASGTLSHLETGKFRGDLDTHQKLARRIPGTGYGNSLDTRRTFL